MKKLILPLFFLFTIINQIGAQTDEIIISKKKIKENSPLYILDGKIIDNINTIPANEIASVNVLKGAMATEKYGKKGINGVVIISSKKNEKKDSLKISLHSSDINQEKKDTNVTMKVVVEGNKITINGKEVDENDPRLNIEGKDKKRIILKKLDKKQPSLSSKDPIILDENEQYDDENFDWVKPNELKMNQAFLGVITEANEQGAKINEVSEESPAAKAGLKEGDIITKVNDIKIDGPAALYDAIGKFKPEQKVTISYISNNKKLSLEVNLAKNKNLIQSYNFNKPNNESLPNLKNFQPKLKGFNFSIPNFPGNDDRRIAGLENKPKLGISIEDIENEEGVHITNVTENSPAAKSGLKENDIIIKVNDEKIKDVDALKPIIKDAKEGAHFTFQIKRNKELKTIIVKLPRMLKTADL